MMRNCLQSWSKVNWSDCKLSPWAVLNTILKCISELVKTALHSQINVCIYMVHLLHLGVILQMYEDQEVLLVYILEYDLWLLHGCPLMCKCNFETWNGVVEFWMSLFGWMSFNKSVKTLTCDVWLSGYYYLMTGVVLHFINLDYGATSVDQLT